MKQVQIFWSDYNRIMNNCKMTLSKNKFEFNKLATVIEIRVKKGSYIADVYTTNKYLVCKQEVTLMEKSEWTFTSFIKYNELKAKPDDKVILKWKAGNGGIITFGNVELTFNNEDKCEPDKGIEQLLKKVKIDDDRAVRYCNAEYLINVIKAVTAGDSKPEVKIEMDKNKKNAISISGKSGEVFLMPIYSYKRYGEHEE